MKAIYTFLLAIMALMAGGCTQNDGSIGAWFGTWRLAEIEINGAVDTQYPHDVIWKFHGEIVSIITVDDAAHQTVACWGTWTDEGDAVTLRFTYSDDSHPNDSPMYSPPASIHLPAGVTTLNVKKLTTGEIVLEYVGAEATYTYYLRKHG